MICSDNLCYFSSSHPPFPTLLSSLPGDPLEQLVRHFLIETGPRGVKIKGCQNESYFGQLCGRHNCCQMLHVFSYIWYTGWWFWPVKLPSKSPVFFLLILSYTVIFLTSFLFLSLSGSLSALVYQHSITPISLPCALRIPEKGNISTITFNSEEFNIHLFI